MIDIIYGVQILVQNDDKFLILKRSDNDRKAPGCWNLPGGKFESGEIWHDTSKRELFEETGIILENFILLESSFRPFVRHKLNNFSFQSHLSYGFISNSTVKLNDEHSEYKWVGLDEFDKYGVLCYSYDELKKCLERM